MSTPTAPAAGPPSPEDAFLAEAATPRWIRDVFRFLPIKAQFILSGNIRDFYPFPNGKGGYNALTLTRYLTEALRRRGYERFVAFDGVDGFTPLLPAGGDLNEGQQFFEGRYGLRFEAAGSKPPAARCSLNGSLATIEAMVNDRDHFVAVFADFASRYMLRPDQLNEHEHEYFVKAQMLGQRAGAHGTSRTKDSQFNPIFWICDKENDLPGWFSAANPCLRPVTLPTPDVMARRTLVDSLLGDLPGAGDCVPPERTRHRDTFVEQTEGMLLRDLVAIVKLCRREQLTLPGIGEAVRRYKLGVTEDPWKKIDRQRVADGVARIGKRVKGQLPAVHKSLDIIKRAITGLSGAQGSALGGRPRGVLFLAGPTGVGKTELAKSLTELLFGDERAYIRFDMSEFSAEHSDQRLVGAPPSYVGYEAGGELTNAIRERPFSVVLFDEIEKAHPRVLDKFLQLLDEGVLTSGRGERVYFSESVIVFTSNLGITRQEADGRFVPLVDAARDDYAAVSGTVRAEIARYFKFQLNRPELLNRIGENIVVFDFVRPGVAAEIFDKMLAAVLCRLLDQRRIEAELGEEARARLRELCTADLSNGGRGVSNQLEAWLVNPLARALFDQEVPDGARIVVRAVGAAGGVPAVELTVLRSSPSSPP